MDVGRVTGKAAYLVAVVVCVSACAGAPLSERRDRTPYERYQALRGESRPKTVTDSFGKEHPALRQRLAPLDQP